MLINGTQQEELRVALVDGQKLYDLDIESPGHEQKKANIYKGTITRVEPSLEAAFVDYGAERHGFLPLKEIGRTYFPKGYKFEGRPNIKEVIKEGQEVIVQIDKEERGQKGAALTTFISLAGSYLVLMPNNPRAGGISRRIEGDERTELKAALSGLNLPDGMGLIVRTAGVGKSSEELAYDLDYLVSGWGRIKEMADSRPAPFLIHQESDVVVRAIRDYLRRDIGEILIDKTAVHERALKHVEQMRPDYANRVKLYKGDVPLFSHYQIESQIESAFQREVRLPSGGSIVIDPTEALISIDINSARATKGSDIEETAFNTNLEAADEIARQLRLRDAGGLVVIDFIDMTPVRHQREVENRMKEAVRGDRARVQLGRISRFGLLEMSRQRLRPSLGDSAHNVCPRCSGHGTVRGTESLALSVLRIMEEESIKDNTGQIEAQLPVNVATYLLNEKRKSVRSIEKRHSVQLVIIPNPNMETPHYSISRRRPDEALQDMSYNLPLIEQEETITDKTVAPALAKEQPALQSLIEPNKARPTQVASKPAAEESLLTKIGKWFQGLLKEEPKEVPKKNTRTRNQNGSQRKGKNSRNDRNKRNGKNYERNEKNDRGERNDRNDKSTKRNERSDRKPRNDNRKPRRNDKAHDTEAQTNQNQEVHNNVPAKKKEKVAERRKRRDTRRSVRVESEKVENTKSTTLATKEETANAENIDTNSGPSVTTAATDVNTSIPAAETSPANVEATTEKVETSTVSNDEEQKPRTRSRRSPRHVRAAGQKRRKETEVSDDTAGENKTTDITEANGGDTIKVEAQVAEEGNKAPEVKLTQAEPSAKQDELQFDEPAKVEETPVPVVEQSTPEQVSLELSDDEPKAIEPTPAPAEIAPVVEAKAAEVEAPKVKASEAPIKAKVAPKATSLKVSKKVKSQSVSAPMARPAEITEDFIEINIGSLADEARPELTRSTKTAAILSASNKATAPAFRPGTDS
ncbi:MAG: ribonuclease E [Paraglaciecola sp.]|uniref:ribonuclease E n=2 Tax=Paraglaciecola sp. TaxID=1920173 RepID=UPI0032995ABA